MLGRLGDKTEGMASQAELPLLKRGLNVHCAKQVNGSAEDNVYYLVLYLLICEITHVRKSYLIEWVIIPFITLLIAPSPLDFP